MQLSTMRTECRLIINETEPDNSHFTEAQLNSWANECYRYIMTRLGALPIKERTYTSAATITLNSSVLTIDQAYLKAQPQNKYTALGLIDLATLEAMDSQWPDAATGIPEYLVRKDAATALMYPPPNADNTGQNVLTYGIEFPSVLSSDTDTPNLPANLHDLFPHYMSYRGFQGLNQPERSQQALILVNGQLKAQQAISTKFSDQRMRWIWHDSD